MNYKLIRIEFDWVDWLIDTIITIPPEKSRHMEVNIEGEAAGQ